MSDKTVVVLFIIPFCFEKGQKRENFAAHHLGGQFPHSEPGLNTKFCSIMTTLPSCPPTATLFLTKCCPLSPSPLLLEVQKTFCELAVIKIHWVLNSKKNLQKDGLILGKRKWCMPPERFSTFKHQPHNAFPFISHFFSYPIIFYTFSEKNPEKFGKRQINTTS